VQYGRVQSYVRPLCAARMAAGPDDIRGLNPIHVGELDALTMPRVCPIAGLDRFASRHNHPSQAEELFYPLAGLSRSLMQQQALEPDSLPC
jgi:hypothetical protein